MVEDAVTTAFKRARSELRPLLQKETSTGCTIDNTLKARSSTEGPSYRYDAAFFRDGVAESILTDEKLRRVVLGTAIHPQAGSSVLENDIRRIIVAPGLQRILLTILCFGTGSMLRSFEERFLGENHCRYSDKDLPFDQSLVRELFGEEDATIFFQYQSNFVALTLGTGKDAEYGPHHILPYVPDKELGRGGFGKVDQVKVERGHFLYREPPSRNRDPVFLARKQFEPDAESFRSFERERRTLRQLADQKTCPSNIVTAICTLVCTLPQGRKLGSIFFPPAICDLDAYIRNDANFPNNEARRGHIQQMVEVCDAMHWLSENLRHDSTTGKYVEKSYIHYDMKPSNILIYEDVSVGNGAVIFKIADFGQTREINRHYEGRAGRKNKASPFPDAGRIYEGTFRAPEIHGQNVRDKNVEKGDVWSFGCILLLVILFGAQGAQAIEEFEDHRIRKSLSGRDDSFCNPQNRANSVCNQAVLDCLASLREHEVSADMHMNKNMMKHCIDYLRIGVLVKDTQRDNISKVCKKLREIYNQLEPRSATPSSVNHGELPRGAYRLGHSPDGKIFCCSRDKIYLYTPRRPILNPTNNHHPWSRVVKAESSSCSRETLCVVAEWKEWFRCTLFKIGSEDSAPRDVVIRAITKPALKVALSPDDRMLAIACKPDEDGKAFVRLFYLEDLSP
ncbi:unnamed protein product [Clonostachys chloroleuca]|uniref:Protein kinase domain-containing protein n=1 Tax=Clonostachys chloroleuca TaxID=1926264 RepID=A0AA35MD26_9HYPO|nr:unnamed protein product [Clonostachys chloroleuca]